MVWLIIGLVLFFAVHVFSSVRGARQKLIARIGEGPYKGLYSLLSVAGFALIVVGMMKATPVELWTPPDWGRLVIIWLMPVAFISLIAAYVPGNIRRVTAHPMLWGVTLWSLLQHRVEAEAAEQQQPGEVAIREQVTRCRRRTRVAESLRRGGGRSFTTL